MKKRPMSAEEIRRMIEELKEICKPGDRGGAYFPSRRSF